MSHKDEWKKPRTLGQFIVLVIQIIGTVILLLIFLPFGITALAVAQEYEFARLIMIFVTLWAAGVILHKWLDRRKQ